MKIVNTTKNSKIANEAQLYESILLKMKGLMLRKINKDQALIMKFNRENNFFIHGFFCFQTLQLIGIKDNKVVEMHILKPWRIKRIRNKIDYLIETLPKKNISLGDELKISS